MREVNDMRSAPPSHDNNFLWDAAAPVLEKMTGAIPEPGT
jgi:hypothetical protein